MKTPAATAVVHEANSARMWHVNDDEAAMVFTSPPYFSEATEEQLRRPLREQREPEPIWRELTVFAASLRPNFEEIARVLRPGGILVLQTKDIRYGEFLLPLAGIHGELALNSGLNLRTRIDWLASGLNPARRPAFLKQPEIGNFRAMDTEQFLVFSKGPVPPSGCPVGDLGDMEKMLIEPLWRTAPARGGDRHAFGSPPEVVRRFIRLFSAPGDLVVEPFCGFGTTLVEARRLGRRCVGYEIDHECVRKTLEKLK